MAKPVILFLNDYFDRQTVDGNFTDEYTAAIKTPTLDVALFDLTRFEESRVIQTQSDIASAPLLVYRGWMMKPQEYDVFYEKLVALGAHPITAPEHYSNLHLFPRVYPSIAADTPRVIFGDDTSDLYGAVTNSFKQFMLKDYVKSVKGTAFPSVIDGSIAKEGFTALLEQFKELRGDLYTDGLVFKEYVELKKRDGRTNEWRVFYLNGSILTAERNSGQPKTFPEPPQELIKKYASLNSPYYTVDYAELHDGNWTIIETGDGQVSGLASEQPPALYYSILGETLFRFFSARCGAPRCLS